MLCEIGIKGAITQYRVLRVEKHTHTQQKKVSVQVFENDTVIVSM